jgi:hypothetical protein
VVQGTLYYHRTKLNSLGPVASVGDTTNGEVAWVNVPVAAENQPTLTIAVEETKTVVVIQEIAHACTERIRCGRSQTQILG